MNLSVIVPCFNVERFIPETVASLVRNASSDIEFVFVDDASTDGTVGALERWSPRLANSRLVELADNGGPSRARNAGLEVATGRYVTYLDADDCLVPGYLPLLRESIVRLGCDFVRVDHVQFDGTARWIVRSPENRRDTVFGPRDSILPSTRSTGVDYPSPGAGIYDRERLAESLMQYHERLHTAEDREWLWRLYLAADSHAVVGLRGYLYRRGITNSLTQVGDARQLHFLDSFDLVLSHVRRDSDANRLLPKAVRTYCSMLYFHLERQARLSPDLRERLRVRTVDALNSFEPDVLAEVLAGMDENRADTLSRVQHGGSVGPPVRTLPNRAARRLRRLRLVTV